VGFGWICCWLPRLRNLLCPSTSYAVGECTGNCFVRESLKRASRSAESVHCQGRGVHLTDLVTLARYYLMSISSNIGVKAQHSIAWTAHRLRWPIDQFLTPSPYNYHSSITSLQDSAEKAIKTLPTLRSFSMPEIRPRPSNPGRSEVQSFPSQRKVRKESASKA